MRLQNIQNIFSKEVKDLPNKKTKKKNVFKDHTFSGFDLIRFFLNNLDKIEIYQVYDFFHSEDIEQLFEIKLEDIQTLLERYFDFIQDVGRLFYYIKNLQWNVAIVEYVRLVKVKNKLVIDTLDKFPYFRKLSRRYPQGEKP